MREFRKTTGRLLRPVIWRIFIDSNDPKTYIIQWGLQDGVMQETQDTPGTCGVKGHSDYQTAEDYAIFCMNREIRKKIEQGYIEYIYGKPINEVVSVIDFTKALPKNLCFCKPVKKIPEKLLVELYRKNRIIWTLKRDGMMHIAVNQGGKWQIYSRRMDLVTEKYPHIILALEDLCLPNNTILLGEMCFFNNDGSDNFKNVSRICQSKSDLALAYQGFQDFPARKKNEFVLGKLHYYVFDIAFYGGRDLISNESVGKRLDILDNIFRKTDNKYIVPVEICHTSPDKDLEFAKLLKIEGFVILDINARYGDKAYSFDGKAQRPGGIWKRKPKYEDEFIITGYYEGTGRNRGRLGGFTLEQIHPETGNRINCGKCGGGFTDKQRIDFLKLDLVGKTIKVEFDSRQFENNGIYALRFPEFRGLSDKVPEECIAQDDWPPK